jgi:hypothetical protein
MSDDVAVQLCDFREAQKVLDQISSEDLVTLRSMSSAMLAVFGAMEVFIEKSLEGKGLDEYLNCTRGVQWGILLLLVYQLENSTEDTRDIWDSAVANLKVITESLSSND